MVGVNDVWGRNFLLVGHQQKGVGMILMWGEILVMRILMVATIYVGKEICW